ncbi:hypothetical protein RCL1_008565 [Eukaryota sp. TZLM3-RCL]
MDEVVLFSLINIACKVMEKSKEQEWRSSGMKLSTSLDSCLVILVRFLRTSPPLCPCPCYHEPSLLFSTVFNRLLRDLSSSLIVSEDTTRYFLLLTHHLAFSTCHNVSQALQNLELPLPYWITGYFRSLLETFSSEEVEFVCNNLNILFENFTQSDHLKPFFVRVKTLLHLFHSCSLSVQHLKQLHQVPLISEASFVFYSLRFLLAECWKLSSKQADLELLSRVLLTWEWHHELVFVLEALLLSFSLDEGLFKQLTEYYYKTHQLKRAYMFTKGLKQRFGTNLPSFVSDQMDILAELGTISDSSHKYQLCSLKYSPSHFTDLFHFESASNIVFVKVYMQDLLEDEDVMDQQLRMQYPLLTQRPFELIHCQVTTIGFKLGEKSVIHMRGIGTLELSALPFSRVLFP